MGARYRHSNFSKLHRQRSRTLMSDDIIKGSTLGAGKLFQQNSTLPADELKIDGAVSKVVKQNGVNTIPQILTKNLTSSGGEIIYGSSMMEGGRSKQGNTNAVRRKFSVTDVHEEVSTVLIK